jgi:hypothetical protein
MHTTIELWITTPPHEIGNASRLLDTAKDRLFAEEMQLITALRTHTHFSKFDPRLGGKFPESTYNIITSEIQTVLVSMALMAQTTSAVHELSAQKESTWLQNLSRALKSTNFNSHITTSLLCHLSAAVSNGLGLPPYLSPPASFGLARELRRSNTELLDIKNADEPSFSAFASLEVLSGLVSVSLTRLVRCERRTLISILNLLTQ